MAQHTITRPAETKSAFIERCVTGGGTRDSCERAWERKLNLGNFEGDYFFLGGIPGKLAEDNLVAEDGGRKRFQKDILQVGVFTQEGGFGVLDIDDKRLARFEAANVSFRKNGIPVPIVLNHDQSAENSLGFVEKIFKVGNKLFANLNFVNEDAALIARAAGHVSVGIRKDFKDGVGNSYGEAIAHIGIVNQPIVPGQGDFKELGLTTDKGPPIFLLTQTLVNQPGDTMPEHTPEALMKTLTAILGLAEGELTLENAAEKVDARLKELSAEKEGAEKRAIDAEAEVKAALEKSSAPVDKDLLEIKAGNAEEHSAALVDAHILTPGVRDKLLSILAGEEGNRNAYCLSQSISGTPTSIMKQVLNALKDNDPVKLGEQSKAQLLSITNPAASGEDSDADQSEDMLKTYNQGAPA